MTMTTGVGGCSAILHIVAQYPKVAACAAILGVGGYSLSGEQQNTCDTAIAQCQANSQAPSPQKVPPITKEDVFTTKWD